MRRLRSLSPGLTCTHKRACHRPGTDGDPGAGAAGAILLPRRPLLLTAALPLARALAAATLASPWELPALQGFNFAGG